MTEKTLDLYNQVMRRISDVVNTEFPGEGFAVDILISDFEDAILLAMETAFPRARSRGCWFHYSQVILFNLGF